jgi:hypothetical protein
MTTHTLKTWPVPFAAVLSGAKTHEIRKADRAFAVGDRLLLREWQDAPSNNVCKACDETMTRWEDYNEWQHADCGGLVVAVPDRGYTGRELLVEVTHISPGGTWGLPSGLCVMSIRRVEQPAPGRYSHIVAIVREGDPEVRGFHDYKAAFDWYDAAGTQWSESFLCEVVKGPLV